MKDAPTFGSWVKRQRQALGLTQKELARRVGCATVTLRKVEAGDLRPSWQMARKLADTLALEPAQQAQFVRFARSEAHWNETELGDVLPPIRPFPVPPRQEWDAPAAANTHNLPLHLSTFIGREKEIADVSHWLATHRLVTLTGAGGCGKTRLAVQTASALLPKFAGGVWLIEFAPVADPMFVVQVAAAALGVGEQPARSLAETLADHLRRRPALLLFDNCEHLIAACAQLATTLLQRCPDLHILATSREPLGVTGEVAWGVPPLSLPEPQPWQDLSSSNVALAVYEQSEAVRLFVARATTVAPSFSLSIENSAWVAEICRRLDGMPLAIELAAARVRALSVREIAQRLDDRFRLLTAGSRTAPPRQQTLAATLDWSYRLLDEAERKVLQRLAVFAGGCTLAAAEAVCADENMGADAVLDVLAHLVDKSLVVADRKEDGVRYHLLETIRQYALEKLLESGEMDQVRERHCAYFVAWAEEAQARLSGPSEPAWLGRYEAEWYFPIRQLLGAELMAVGQAEAAEAVYRKDLEQYPANGWSLYGLAQALEAQDKTDEAATVRGEFEEAWRGSDIVLAASTCPCEMAAADEGSSATKNDAAHGHVSPSDPVDVQIANAMSAAPMAIARDAAVYGFPADESGEMVLLRERTNGWTCFTDWPASPSNDPMCNDPVFNAWNEAFYAGEEPQVTEPGISYMLMGGDDTSNTDPFAPAPAADGEWVFTPPHIMIVLPGDLDPAVFSTDHTSGEPYIMWEGTPYEHLMVPVADMEGSH